MMKNKFHNIVILSFLLLILSNLSIFAQSTFSRERVKSAIKSYVQSHSKYDVRVEIEQIIRDFEFNQSGVKAEIKHQGELRGKTNLILNFRKNNKIVGSNKIRVRIFCYDKFPIVKHFVGKGKTLKESDIKIAKVDITNLSAPLITKVDEAIGKVTKRGIAKGNPIKLSDLINGKEVFVKRGAKVNLLYYSGAILIKSSGTALQDGSTGDIIKVKKDNSNTIYGFIAEDGNVIIEKKETLENFLQTEKK